MKVEYVTKIFKIYIVGSQMIPITVGESKLGEYLKIKGINNISLENNLTFIFEGPNEEYEKYLKTVKLFLFFNNIKYFFVNKKLDNNFNSDFKQLTHELVDIYNGTTTICETKGIELGFTTNINAYVDMEFKVVYGIMSDDERINKVNSFFNSILEKINIEKSIDKFVLVSEYFNNAAVNVISYSNFVALITILEILSYSSTDTEPCEKETINKRIKKHIKNHHSDLKFFDRKFYNVSYDIYDIRSDIVHIGNIKSASLKLLEKHTFKEIYFELIKVVINIIKNDFKRELNIKNLNIFEDFN